MRFLVATLVLCLVSATSFWSSSYGAGTSGESCGTGHHEKCKQGKKKKLQLEYDWGINITDENLGRDTEDDDEFKIRGVSTYLDAGLIFSKKWEGLESSVYLLMTEEKLSDGLLEAMVTAELPRSYLSVSVGKSELDFGGYREHTSSYLKYHSPFPRYGRMARIFSPIEGMGELSLMLADDVHGEGWHNEDKSVVGMFQYSGKFNNVSPLLQFVSYDYYNSWAMTAGLELKVDKLTLHLDYTRDNRKNTDEDETTTVYSNYVADLAYRSGMIGTNLEVSLFMTANEDVETVQGNHSPAMEEYGEMKDGQKYSTNMMSVRFGFDFYCIDDKFVPYVSYNLKSHKIDPDWTKETDDGDVEDQMSHSFAVGIWGVI